jgi:hypothetical protein
MTMHDPLHLNSSPQANEDRLARAAPHPEVHRLYTRLTSNQHADSVELRVLLLTHLVYIAYRDLKESFHL